MHSKAICKLHLNSTVCSYTYTVCVCKWYCVCTGHVYKAIQFLSHVRDLMYSVFVLLSCFSLVNCLWILNLFVYINICSSLTHFLSNTCTHTAWVSPHLEQIKSLSCLWGYPEVSECWCWELVLVEVSVAGEEMKRNHTYPGVAELRKFY